MIIILCCRTNKTLHFLVTLKFNNKSDLRYLRIMFGIYARGSSVPMQIRLLQFSVTSFLYWQQCFLFTFRETRTFLLPQISVPFGRDFSQNWSIPGWVCHVSLFLARRRRKNGVLRMNNEFPFDFHASVRKISRGPQKCSCDDEKNLGWDKKFRKNIISNKKKNTDWQTGLSRYIDLLGTNTYMPFVPSMPLFLISVEQSYYSQDHSSLWSTVQGAHHTSLLLYPGTPPSQKIGPNQGGGFLEYPAGTKLELRFGHFPPRNRDFEGPK